MTSVEIRESFLQFFRERGHTVVPSASVIPYNDPTLLFTNAGMNQFKDVFLGLGTRPYTRAVDTQKCIRVSGKHNDLEEVGRDTYHHTFFEMLGNWSFGDYYKNEAISWAWELLTKVWGLPKERLWATVYKDDDEAENIWKTVTNIDHSHILRFGEKENFWEMGETGPCGPCSEIHIDRTPQGTATAKMVNAGTPDVIEIWNLVFIQFNRDENGALHPLPSKHVDTGMGFERICAVLQNKTSNYDTDVFSPLLQKISEISNKSYAGTLYTGTSNRQEEVDIAMRVIADHIRTLTFAIGDGALPSNEGRGYVLRRILRRAARFGRTLDLHEPFLYKLAPVLVDTMSNVFPEIKIHQEHIQKIIKGEEESFNATLDRGLERFEEIAQRDLTSSQKIISGEDVFRLYDTYGFPVDLTALLAQEKGLNIDTNSFEKLMEEQRARSRESGKSLSYGTNKIFSLGDRTLPPTEFVGYTEFECDATVLDVENNFVILDKTPFYAESGGQVGDTGILQASDINISVEDTQKDGDIFGHIVEASPTELIGKKVHAAVDKERRLAIMRNHSATHLLHNALRKVLGTHVHQAGSFVGPEYLRFDFAHYAKLSDKELQEIESLVNEKIQENIPRTPNLNNIPFEEAKKMGALMFFGEKYGDRVNVIQFGDFSTEFCGGTHVNSTGEIGYFKILREESIASGVRRIEAVTHTGALEALKSQDAALDEKIKQVKLIIEDTFSLCKELNSLNPQSTQHIENILKTMNKMLEGIKNIPPIPNSVSPELGKHFAHRNKLNADLTLLSNELIDIRKKLEKEISHNRVQSKSEIIDSLIANSRAMNGYRVVASKVEATSLDELKSLGDLLRAKLQSGIGVLATVIDNKVQLVCVVTDDLIVQKKADAGKIVRDVAKLVNGGGGGKPHLATAGGKDIANIENALSEVAQIVEKLTHS